MLSDCDTRDFRIAMGSLCSSISAELFAPRTAIEQLAGMGDHGASQSMVVCSDSRAALALLQSSHASQKTPAAANSWSLLRLLPERKDSPYACSGCLPNAGARK